MTILKVRLKRLLQVLLAHLFPSLLPPLSSLPTPPPTPPHFSLPHYLPTLSSALPHFLASFFPSVPPSLSLPSLHLLKWKDEEGQEQEFRLVKWVSARWYDFGMLLGLELNQLDVWRIQYQGDTAICWNKVHDSILETS